MEAQNPKNQTTNRKLMADQSHVAVPQLAPISQEVPACWEAFRRALLAGNDQQSD